MLLVHCAANVLVTKSLVPQQLSIALSHSMIGPSGLGVLGHPVWVFWLVTKSLVPQQLSIALSHSMIRCPALSGV